MSAPTIRLHVPTRHAHGMLDSGARKAIRCRFNNVTFALIRSKAERERVSFAEAVRRLIAHGLEAQP